MSVIQYINPDHFVKFDALALLDDLTSAKAAVLSLTTIPYQRSWVEALQVVQLKREVAGTSRIEGADFTEREFEAALKESPSQLSTRSQRQAAAAVKTYRWIAQLPNDQPVNTELIKQIHRLIVTDADDDHCPPGVIRGKDTNVVFGYPRHRGCEGGKECEEAFESLNEALRTVFPRYDLLIQALALHYHFASMHPFEDGNGRTARAVEALMLQRAGLRDSTFIAMSNYYYDEKGKYLESLAAARALNHDLTPFLIFGLKGITQQCRRLFDEIKEHILKALFKNQMHYLFGRLRTSKKRVIAERQLKILNLLLDASELRLDELAGKTDSQYTDLSNPRKSLIRDLNHLIMLGAIRTYQEPDTKQFVLKVVLNWPEHITESDFYKTVTALPKSKTTSFLS